MSIRTMALYTILNSRFLVYHSIELEEYEHFTLFNKFYSLFFLNLLSVAILTGHAGKLPESLHSCLRDNITLIL